MIARALLPQGVDAPYDIPALSQKLGVNNIIEGTVREDHNCLRITVRVLGTDGFQVSSHRFETEADAESLTHVQELIATGFISRARPEQSRIRRRKATPGRVDDRGLSARPPCGESSGRGGDNRPASCFIEVSRGERVRTCVCAIVLWNLPLLYGDGSARHGPIPDFCFSRKGSRSSCDWAGSGDDRVLLLSRRRSGS